MAVVDFRPSAFVVSWLFPSVPLWGLWLRKRGHDRETEEGWCVGTKPKGGLDMRVWELLPVPQSSLRRRRDEEAQSGHASVLSLYCI